MRVSTQVKVPSSDLTLGITDDAVMGTHGIGGEGRNSLLVAVVALANLMSADLQKQC